MSVAESVPGLVVNTATGAVPATGTPGSTTLPEPPDTGMVTVSDSRVVSEYGALVTLPEPSSVTGLSSNQISSMASTWWPATAITSV